MNALKSTNTEFKKNCKRSHACLHDCFNFMLSYTHTIPGHDFVYLSVLLMQSELKLMNNNIYQN